MISFGGEIKDNFVVLKLPSPEDAVRIFKHIRGETSTPNPLLVFQDNETPVQMFVSYNRYGRAKVVEFFVRNALKALKNNRVAIGLSEDDDLSVSYVTGGLVVNDSLIGHVSVGKVRADSGHYPVSCTCSEKRFEEGLSRNFAMEEFLRIWRAAGRL